MRPEELECIGGRSLDDLALVASCVGEFPVWVGIEVGVNGAEELPSVQHRDTTEAALEVAPLKGFIASWSEV